MSASLDVTAIREVFFISFNSLPVKSTWHRKHLLHCLKYTKGSSYLYVIVIPQNKSQAITMASFMAREHIRMYINGLELLAKSYYPIICFLVSVLPATIISQEHEFAAAS